MKKVESERFKKLAARLGYSCDELYAKSIDAMLKWIDGDDEKQIPEFILKIRKKQSELKRD